MYKKILILWLFLFLLNSCWESKIEDTQKDIKIKTQIEQNNKKEKEKMTEKEVKEKVEKKLISSIDEFWELWNFLKNNLTLEEKKFLKKNLKRILWEEKSLQKKAEKFLKEAEKNNDIENSLKKIKKVRNEFYNKIIKYVWEKQKEEFKQFCFPKIESIREEKKEKNNITNKIEEKKVEQEVKENKKEQEEKFIKIDLKKVEKEILEKKKKELLWEEKDLNSKLKKLFVNLENSKNPELIIEKADKLRQKYYDEMLPYIKEENKESFKEYCFPSDKNNIIK